MDKSARKTGLCMIGDVPWGTHFCQFYSTREDLLDILVPYFKAGLDNNEFCMWVTSEPLEVDEAVQAMRSAIPVFDERMERGQIEIIPYTAWYKKNGRFDSDEVLAGWVSKLEAALKAGYEGLRLSGNTFWLERSDWKGFKAYEEAVDTVIGTYRMIAICTYSLEKCTATDIMDVLSNHSFALIRREGQWEAVESFGRRLMEKKLSESENKYKIISDNTYGWEFWIAPDGRYLYVSPSCEKISGRKPEEFIADQGLRKRIVAPEHMALFERHLAETEKYRPGALEFKIMLPDGSRRWIGHVCQPVYDNEGRFQGTRGSNLDITERKLSEEKISMSEEKYRTLFDSMLNGFGLHEVICGEDGKPCDYRFIEVNRAFEELTGIKRDSIIGKTVLEVLPRTESYWIETFGNVALTGNPASIENYSRELGKYYEVVAYSPRKGQFAAIFADVTERKRMEDELLKAKADLEIRVAERTAELESTLTELERSNKELENFAYIASHDLKEPLLMVSSYIHLLVRKYRGRLGEEEADRFIEHALTGIERMERMISDLLEYSRIQTQARPFSEVDSAELLDQALDNLVVSIKETGAEISFGPLPGIHGDPTQLTRVFQNLIANALKFRKAGQPPIIRISCVERPGDWLFSVSDNGIGIAPVDTKSIFMLFQRIHGKEYPGSGIGLAVTKRIIERHGGSVWVESEPSKGSKFFFTIPKNRAHNRPLGTAA